MLRLRSLRIIAAAFPLLAAGLAFGDITGSKHDFMRMIVATSKSASPATRPTTPTSPINALG